MKLHNTVNGDLLKQQLANDEVARTTISFYKYWNLGNPHLFRDHLYLGFESLDVLGRIYVSYEGINAQLSIPQSQLDQFRAYLDNIIPLQNIRLNIAVEDDGKSFFKLAIKVRDKIVADGIEDESFDPSQTGEYLKAEAFNQLTDKEDTILVDMRNHYESEVGHFKGAWCPDVDTFREELPLVVDELAENKEQPVVMYCTGGIRCEKASAYLKHKGFKHVYHLEGGIINYARQVEQEGLENKFIGKNFVFDQRIVESVSNEVIAHCHQCGSSFDHHRNCNNIACNLLFIQCPECEKKMDGCCSEACVEVNKLPEEEQKALRRGKDSGVRIFSKGRFPITPNKPA